MFPTLHALSYSTAIFRLAEPRLLRADRVRGRRVRIARSRRGRTLCKSPQRLLRRLGERDNALWRRLRRLIVSGAVERGRRDLKALDDPVPTAVWHSFGFNLAEGWREDGFSVAYRAEHANAGRKEIMRLANKYRQAAIYSYRVDREGRLVRSVVWCDEKTVTTSETMAIVTQPPDSPLAGRRSAH